MDRELRRLTIEDYDDIIRLWSDAGLPYKPKGRDSREKMQKEMEFSGTAFFGLFEGVKMVATQLENVLEQHGCKQIKAVAEPFDPNLHEAIGQEPSDEIPANYVSRQFQMGYQLHERVIRPSQVFVSTGSAPTAKQG